jgi:hypothetical protein
MGTITKGQIRKLGSELLDAIPDDLDGEVAQGWVKGARLLLPRILRAGSAEIERVLKALWPFKDQRPLEWGWKGVEREGAPCESPVDIKRLEFVPFHKDGEDWVGGGEMRRRSADERAFPGCKGWSQHHAEDILERASELPEEAKQFIIVFADTVLFREDGDRCVPCLVWGVGQWQLRWLCLGGDFLRFYRFLRLRK